MSAVICSTCGSELPSGEDTCPRCGTRVPPHPPTPTAPPPSQSPQTAASPPAAHAPSPAFPSAPLTPAPAAVPPRLSPYVEEQVQSLLRNGHISLRRGNLRAARDLCEQALALNEPDPNAHELIGLIMEAEGDEIGAYREYQKACEGEYKPTEAETRLAKLALRMPPETLAMLQPQKRSAVENELPPEAAERLQKEARPVLTSIELSASLKPRRHASAPSFASLLLPGFGQLLKEEYVKAAVMFVIWMVAIVWIFSLAHTSTKLNPAYNDPTVWAAVVIIVLDYLVSIVDARSSS